jgi:hypothetical protein
VRQPRKRKPAPKRPKRPATEEAAPVRDERGLFLPGNQIGKGGPRDQSKKIFSAAVREFIDRPEVQEQIFRRILRDLKGRGPAPFAIRALEYAYGSPKQSFDVHMSGALEMGDPAQRDARLLELLDLARKRRMAEATDRGEVIDVIAEGDGS